MGTSPRDSERADHLQASPCLSVSEVSGSKSPVSLLSEQSRPMLTTYASSRHPISKDDLVKPTDQKLRALWQKVTEVQSVRQDL